MSEENKYFALHMSFDDSDIELDVDDMEDDEEDIDYSGLYQLFNEEEHQRLLDDSDNDGSIDEDYDEDETLDNESKSATAIGEDLVNEILNPYIPEKIARFICKSGWIGIWPTLMDKLDDSSKSHAIITKVRPGKWHRLNNNSNELHLIHDSLLENRSSYAIDVEKNIMVTWDPDRYFEEHKYDIGAYYTVVYSGIVNLYNHKPFTEWLDRHGAIAKCFLTYAILYFPDNPFNASYVTAEVDCLKHALKDTVENLIVFTCFTIKELLDVCVWGNINLFLYTEEGEIDVEFIRAPNFAEYTRRQDRKGLDVCFSIKQVMTNEFIEEIPRSVSPWDGNKYIFRKNLQRKGIKEKIHIPKLIR